MEQLTQAEIYGMIGGLIAASIFGYGLYCSSPAAFKRYAEQAKKAQAQEGKV